MAGEIERWITVNGAHIPIMKGESKLGAVGRFLKEKREKKVKGIQKAIGLKSDSAARKMYRGYRKEGGEHVDIKGRVLSTEAAEEVARRSKLRYGYPESYNRAKKQMGTHKFNEEQTNKNYKISSDIRKAKTLDDLEKLGTQEDYYKKMTTGQREVASMAYQRREYNGHLVTNGRGLWNEKDYASFRQALDKYNVKEFVNKDSSTGLKDFTISMLNNGYEITGTKVIKEGEKGRLINRDDEVGIVFRKK